MKRPRTKRVDAGQEKWKVTDKMSHNADHLYMYILSHCNIIESPSRSSPSFTLKPKNFTRMQHSAVTFECQAVGTPNANYKLGEIYK